jgi:ribosomal protein S18 acetylase RimI-like enzyme
MMTAKMGEPALYRIGRKDVPEVSAVLRAAFEQHPLTAYFMPDEHKRERQSSAIYDFSVKYGILYGEVYSPTERVEGVAIWYHSSDKSYNAFRAVRAGMMRIFLAFDRGSLEKLRFLIHTLDEIQERLLPVPHWFLSFLAVHPEHQGRGHGGTMLKHMLARIDDEGQPSYLEALGEENVGLYERYGFRVVEEIEFAGQKLWAMVRNE